MEALYRIIKYITYNSRAWFQRAGSRVIWFLRHGAFVARHAVGTLANNFPS